jgi:monovalent cation:H+ antiporter-2, CPA2 family
MFLAAAPSTSSTAIIIKVLEDMGKIKIKSATLIIGVLIIEDLVAIVIISALHSSIIVSGSIDFMQFQMIICEIGLYRRHNSGLVRWSCQEYFLLSPSLSVMR